MRLAVAALAATPLALPAAAPAWALDNGLARTPQLGWNTWNAFGCNVSDQLIRQTADAMVSSGMAAAGYQYINIDDCGMAHSRGANGDLVPAPVKFPSVWTWGAPVGNSWRDTEDISANWRVVMGIAAAKGARNA
jgi:alpha-galactosidase